MNYANHTDEDLIRHANIEFNALTSTHLECILVGRFEAALQEKAIGDAAVEILNDFGLDTDTTKDVEALRKALEFAKDFNLDTVREIMDLLAEEDIDTAGALKPQLEIADQICNSRDEALSDGIAILNKIFNPAPATH